MSSDETMQAPIKSVYRSATISLRKADIARENGDDPEQLAHLRAFVRTVRQSLHSHPLYDRRKTDPECVALDAKVPEVMQRIKTLNGSVSPPAEPADVIQAAASRLERGGGGKPPPSGSSLLLRRSRANSRANSRTNSRAASPEHASAPAEIASKNPPSAPSASTTPAAAASGSTKDASSPSSAEKYRARVEAEAARLKEEAEAVRIASLERKVESVRARLDASASVEFSPTRADRTSAGATTTTTTSQTEPSRTTEPSSSARLRSVEDEVESLRQRIAAAASAAPPLVATPAENTDNFERAAPAPARATLPDPRSATMSAPPPEPDPEREPEPEADRPGAWIARGETAMRPPGERVFARTASLAPPTRLPISPVRAPVVTLPPPPPPPPPGRAEVGLPPTPSLAQTVAALEAAAAAASPVGFSESDSSEPSTNAAVSRGSPAKTFDVVFSRTTPLKPRRVEREGDDSEAPAGTGVDPGSVPATMEGAREAAAEAARAAAEAEAERARRELRAVAEREVDATRRAEAETETLVERMLPLHEENAALRAELARMSSRMERLESAIGASGAGPSATAAAAAAAVASAAAADVDALRAHVARQHAASQDWTAEAIAHHGKEHWDVMQKILTERDDVDRERESHLERRLEDVRESQRAFEERQAERWRAQEAAMESTRRQLLDARAATREMAEAMATQERLTQEREDRAARLRAEFEEKTAERERAERAAPLRVDAAAFAGQLNDMLARLARLENDAGEGSKKALSSTATEAGVGLDPSPSPSSFFPSRLAELEAQVLPTRVSELEDRVSELASAMVDLASAPPPTNPSSASHPRPDDEPVVRVTSSTPASPVRSPGAPFSSEVRDLRARVARLESADVPGTLDRSRAVEATAAAALAQVNVLREEIANVEARVKARVGDEHRRDAAVGVDAGADVRATLTAVEARLSRAEASAAAAVEIASTTSPGTQHAKKALPALRNRVAEMEIDVAGRLVDVETRVKELAEATADNAAALAAVPEFPPPSREPVTPEPVIAEERREKLRALARETVSEAVSEAETRVQTRVAEVETRVAQIVERMEAVETTAASVDPGSVDPAHPSPGTPAYLPSPGTPVPSPSPSPRSAGLRGLEAELATLAARVEKMDEHHRESARTQAEAVAGVVSAAAGAVDALPSLATRVSDLERLHRDAAAATTARAETANADAKRTSEALSEVETKLASALARVDALALSEVETKLASTLTRVDALEADGERASELAVAMAGRVRDAIRDVARLDDARAADAELAATAKTAVAEMAAKVSTLASETAGTIEALRKRQSEAETRAESADAEIQTHARRLRGILGDGSGSAAVEGYVGELQESNAELHAAVRKLRERVEAVAETAEAAAPGRATRELSDAIAELRAWRTADQSRIVTAEEAAAATDRRSGESAATVTRASADLDELRARLIDVEAMLIQSVEATEEEVEARAKASWEAAAKFSEEQAAAAAAATPRERFRKRLDDLEEEHRRRARAAVVEHWAAVRKTFAGQAPESASTAAADPLAEKVDALAHRVDEVERRQSEVSAAKSDADASAMNASAAITAAAAAAGATETLAEEVERLRGMLEAAGRGTAGGGQNLASGETAGPGSSSLEKRAAPDADALAGSDCGEGDASRTKRTEDSVEPRESGAESSYRGLTAEQAATAAAGVTVDSPAGDPDRPDPVERAKVAAANARRAVQEEAARLGITLGGASEIEGGSGTAGGSTGASLSGAPGSPPKSAAATGARDFTELAFAADRQLAAELATVCALVEREEARREQLRVQMRLAGASTPPGSPPATPEDLAAAGPALAEMRAAQRRWESAMDVQLQRLRKAAHEAEERNAVAAAAAGRGRTPHGAPNQRDARERVVAARLAEVQDRVDAMLRAEGIRGGDDADGAEAKHVNPPWGAGPGLRGETKTAANKRGGGIGASTRTALVELERGVRALAEAAGAEPSAGTHGAAEKENNPRDVLEMKSLRAMVRQVQTDIGGISARVDAVNMRATGAGRAEQDMLRAQLSEVRADVKSIKRTIPAAAEEALRRSVAAEKHAAAAHAHCTELGNALSTTRKECARMVERVDLVAHKADAGLRAVDGKVERAKSQVRGAKAASRMAEARAVALAGELGRVARHVGMEGVGDALRTGVLFAPPAIGGGLAGAGSTAEAEDQDLFELPAGALAGVEEEFARGTEMAAVAPNPQSG